MTYTKIKECRSFWTWLHHEYDEPAEMKNDTSGRLFTYCGSLNRRHFLRLFGFEFEYLYRESSYGQNF